MGVRWGRREKRGSPTNETLALAFVYLARLNQINTALQFGTLWLGLTNAVYLFPGDTIFSGVW